MYVSQNLLTSNLHTKLVLRIVIIKLLLPFDDLEVSPEDLIICMFIDYDNAKNIIHQTSENMLGKLLQKEYFSITKTILN